MKASGGSPVPIMKDEYIWITEGIQRLMCYREVRAYFKAYDELYYNLLFGEFREEAMGIFLNDYHESMILEAIEKVKNESK